jgi:hypothetical protein
MGIVMGGLLCGILFGRALAGTVGDHSGWRSPGNAPVFNRPNSFLRSPVAEAIHLYFLAWKVKSAGNGLAPKVTPHGERRSRLSVAPLTSFSTLDAICLEEE